MRQTSAQLKSLVAHEDGATNEVAARLLHLDAALREKSKDAMRVGRELERARAELRYAQQRRGDAEEAAALLEERLVEADAARALGNDGVKHQLRRLAQQGGAGGAGAATSFGGGMDTLAASLGANGGGGALSVGGYETDSFVCEFFCLRIRLFALFCCSFVCCFLCSTTFRYETAAGTKHWDALRAQNATLSAELGETRQQLEALEATRAEAAERAEELESELLHARRSLDIAGGGDGEGLEKGGVGAGARGTVAARRRHTRPEDVEETRQLQEAAQQTVASLNMLLEKKQAAHRRLQRQLEEERVESADARARDLKRISDLSDRLSGANARGLQATGALEAATGRPAATGVALATGRACATGVPVRVVVGDPPCTTLPPAPTRGGP